MSQAIARQQRRLGMRLVQVIDDGERLGQHLAVVELQGRDARLRVDGPVFRRELLAAVLGEMD
jgi:hypothetical protein